MNSTLVYALPSISAIAIKILLFWYGRNIVRTANSWVLMFLAGMLVVNVCELLGIFYARNAEHPNAYRVLVVFYLAILVASAGYCSISMQLAGRFGSRVRPCILSLLAVGLAATAIPGLAMSGVQSIGYSATRIAGPYYWILQILIPLFWLTGCGGLVYAATTAENWVSRRRALALLIGSCPLVVGIVAVTALMEAGFVINATVVVSLATNVLLGILIYTEYESGVFKFLSFVPRTRENRIVFHAARSAYHLTTQGLNRAVADFEKALIDDTIKRCNGNKTTAASLLGVSRATLRRKLSQ